ncbi:MULTISPECIES: hypothetical protein [Bradyrhizobium]|uniref:Uncharacterized protein n=1 Tax=Bradyrhizobium nanningense TaxID=1325118 RepID=A0A4V1L3A0_9BRAD|nr:MULTISPECIES: hypothetical protein [Bradyrhizobium]RXH37243.1 hypothetical protein XH99_03640 [Bradyrhizobium nanningense]TQF32143.1 hypothetical protein UNPA324_22915 [Bradyrhizobium sp. UNPA324]
MAEPDTHDDVAKVASHTLAFLRSLDRKMDLVLETQARHTERLGRLERDVAEVRRDLTEIKSDIALPENKTLTATNGNSFAAASHRAIGGARDRSV